MLEACLTHLSKSLHDSNKSLHNWNEETFAKLTPTIWSREDWNNWWVWW